jgi:hypothetical protein
MKMKLKLTAFGFASVFLMMLISCSGTKLAMEEAMVDPPKVEAGDQAIITVKVVDKDVVVDRVTATVREYPEIVLELSDKGENGDKTIGDGIWSYQIDVPWETNPGVYNWDFNAYDKEGKKLKITNDDGNEVPIGAETAVEVTN